LPGTPELTSNGDYLLAGGGLELVLAKDTGYEVSRLTLDGQNALVPAEQLHHRAAGGSTETTPDGARKQIDAVIEGSTLLVTTKPATEEWQLAERYRLDAARRFVEVTYVFRNTGDRQVAIASAEWHELPIAGGLTYLPIVRGAALGQGTLKLNVWQPLLWFSHDPYRARGEGWLGVYASDGWLANLNAGLLFVKTFADMPKSGAGHAVMLRVSDDPTRRITRSVRLEASTGELQLAPGGESRFTTRWYLRKLPSAIAAKQGNQELLGFVRGVIH
jgi:hypothetical protein